MLTLNPKAAPNAVSLHSAPRGINVRVRPSAGGSAPQIAGTFGFHDRTLQTFCLIADERQRIFKLVAPLSPPKYQEQLKAKAHSVSKILGQIISSNSNASNYSKYALLVTLRW